MGFNLVDTSFLDLPGIAAFFDAQAPKKSEQERYDWTIPLEAQESPHLSDRSKNVGEERLVLQHLGEAMHQRAQPVITHGGQ